MSRIIKYVLLAALLLLMASIPLAREFDSGRLEGMVSSERGPVAAASVELRNVMTGMVLYSKTDSSGLYSFEDLRAACYSLWVQAPGHDSVWIPEVFVEKGRTTHQDVRLASVPVTSAGL
jgi:Carboxypeptidase regulatory-like domain